MVSNWFNDDKNADALFAADDKGEAIEVAKDGGLALSFNVNLDA